MPNLGRTEIYDKSGNRYVLDIGFSAAAVMDDKLVARVLASCFDAETGQKSSVQATLTLDTANNTILIKFPHGNEISINILKNPDAFDDDMRDLNQPNETFKFLANMTGNEDFAKQVIDGLDNIPVPEPALGCVLKAGVVTTMAELIKCHKEKSKIKNLRKKIWEILQCLGTRSHIILAKATLRTIRCWITLGLY